jgi:hypothetical protein
MGIRIESYLFCDQCMKEVQVTNHLPNKHIVKKTAKNNGFLVTKDNEFCSSDCKRSFEKRYSN